MMGHTVENLLDVFADEHMSLGGTGDDVVLTPEELELMIGVKQDSIRLHTLARDEYTTRKAGIAQFRACTTKKMRDAVANFDKSIDWYVEHHNETIAKDTITLAYLKKCVERLHVESLM